MRKTCKRQSAISAALLSLLILTSPLLVAPARADEALASVAVEATDTVASADVQDDVAQTGMTSDSAAGTETNPSASNTSSTQADATKVEDTAKVDVESKENDSGDSRKNTTSASSVAVPKKNILVSVVFNGPDGELLRVPDVSLNQGANAWDATMYALQRSGMAYETSGSATNGVLTSLSAADGTFSYTSDASTGSGWRLYVNGEYYTGSASTYKLAADDAISWVYEVATIDVSVSVVGPGGTSLDYWIAPTNVTILATQNGWDASRMVFDQNGYGDGRLLSYGTDENGSVVLESLASLGSNGITGESWQVFVNGSIPQEDIAHVQLHSGDSICWYYAGTGVSELPMFAEKTGAGSQSPATSVRLSGTVSQVWTQNMDKTNSGFVEQLGMSSGVAVSGNSGSQSLSRVKGLVDPLSITGGATSWNQSLPRLLDDKLSGGSGGKAVLEGGKLFYLDNLGNVVKLELQE